MDKRTQNEQKPARSERTTPKSAAEVARKERVRASAERVTRNHADAIKRLADR